jgi:O-antigen/teichoic acid export membrane protein
MTSRPAGGSGSDVLKVASGATFAQLLSVLVSPIVTRLYGPEAFGTAAIFASIAGIVGVVVCARYELSIVLPDEDSEAANLLGACWLFALLTSLATVPVIVFWGPSIFRLLHAPELGTVVWMLPPVIFVSGVYLSLTFWNARTRRFGRVAIARVSSSGATSAAQVVAGVAGQATGPSLVKSTFLGTSIATMVLGGQILRDDGRLLRRSIRWDGILRGIRRHRKFPMFGTASSLLNAVSWQLPSLLLQLYFSSTIVGFYALGNRILRLPMDLIGNAIGQVFFQRAAQARRDGHLAATVENAFQRLATLSVVPLVLLALVGREAFALVFGPRWAEAGIYAQILAPWTFFWFLSSPLSTLFAVLERQEFGLKLNLAIFATRLASLMLGGRSHDPRLALILFSASGVLVYGYYSFSIIEASGVDRRAVTRFLLLRLFELVPAVVILLGLKIAGAPEWSVVLGAGVLLIVYGIRILRNDPTLAGLIRLRRPGLSPQ